MLFAVTNLSSGEATMKSYDDFKRELAEIDENLVLSYSLTYLPQLSNQSFYYSRR